MTRQQQSGFESLPLFCISFRAPIEVVFTQQCTAPRFFQYPLKSRVSVARSARRLKHCSSRSRPGAEGEAVLGLGGGPTRRRLLQIVCVCVCVCGGGSCLTLTSKNLTVEIGIIYLRGEEARLLSMLQVKSFSRWHSMDLNHIYRMQRRVCSRAAAEPQPFATRKSLPAGLSFLFKGQALRGVSIAR